MKVELINHMGDDLTVVNAARVSFDKESFYSNEEAWLEYDEPLTIGERDVKLIKYLASHGHWTPFSHPQITLRETVPIFVARQRFKHMVGFTYNEVSRRYVDSEPEFYTPEVWRAKADNKKQGSSDTEVIGDVKSTSFSVIDFTSDEFETVYYSEYIESCSNFYRALLEAGVAPEQARMVLPQSMYTSYYVTGSLAAFARAYKQRIDPHAQAEIREVATKWDDIIRPLYPHSWEALTVTTV